jgi:hypothetical protein
MFYLEKIVDPKRFSESILDTLNKCTHGTKLDVLAAIPEMIEDSQHQVSTVKMISHIM